MGAKLELELKVTGSSTSTITNEYSKTVTIDTKVGADSVILSSIPYGQNVYEVASAPAGSENEVGKILTVSLPRKPQTFEKDVAIYNRAGPGSVAVALSVAPSNASHRSSPGSVYSFAAFSSTAFASSFSSSTSSTRRAWGVAFLASPVSK